MTKKQIPIQYEEVAMGKSGKFKKILTMPERYIEVEMNHLTRGDRKARDKGYNMPAILLLWKYHFRDYIKPKTILSLNNLSTIRDKNIRTKQRKLKKKEKPLVMDYFYELFIKACETEMKNYTESDPVKRKFHEISRLVIIADKILKKIPDLPSTEYNQFFDFALGKDIYDKLKKGQDDPRIVDLTTRQLPIIARKMYAWHKKNNKIKNRLNAKRFEKYFFYKLAELKSETEKHKITAINDQEIINKLVGLNYVEELEKYRYNQEITLKLASTHINHIKFEYCACNKIARSMPRAFKKKIIEKVITEFIEIEYRKAWKKHFLYEMGILKLDENDLEKVNLVMAKLIESEYLTLYEKVARNYASKISDIKPESEVVFFLIFNTRQPFWGGGICWFDIENNLLDIEYLTMFHFFNALVIFEFENMRQKNGLVLLDTKLMISSYLLIAGVKRYLSRKSDCESKAYFREENKIIKKLKIPNTTIDNKNEHKEKKRESKYGKELEGEIKEKGYDDYDDSDVFSRDIFEIKFTKPMA